MTIFSEQTTLLAQALVTQCRASNLCITATESCTGGLIGALITSISGASEVFTHGFITYANEAKTEMLGVSETLLSADGAVSESVARAMAEGALEAAKAQLSVSVTGIAGPTGGSAEKPVGLVHMACASDMLETLHEKHVFDGSRDEVRLQAVEAAIKLMLRALSR